MTAKRRSIVRIRSKTSGSPPEMASCTLAIKAFPNAPRSEVVGWLGEVLKLKISAPAVQGRANDALCDFLAHSLGLHRRAVSIQRGDTTRQKLVRIDGLTDRKSVVEGKS